MYPRYLSCFNKFGLTPSASCPVNRNVKDKECLSLVSVLKGCTCIYVSLFLKVYNDIHINKILSSSYDQDFRFTIRNRGFPTRMVYLDIIVEIHHSGQKPSKWVKSLVCLNHGKQGSIPVSCSLGRHLTTWPPRRWTAKKRKKKQKKPSTHQCTFLQVEVVEHHIAWNKITIIFITIISVESYWL